MALSGRYEEIFHPFVEYYIPEIPERFRNKAMTELFETDETRQDGLQELREMINNEEIGCRTTDDFLIQFLRARKFNIEKSFTLLKKYVSFKKNSRRIFTGLEYENMNKLLSSNVIRFLPYRDKDGCAILAAHLYNWSPSEVSIEDLIRSVALHLYHSINDPITQINGYKVLFDVRNQTKHLAYVSPSNLKLLYKGTQECFPGRFKGIHLINMGIAFSIGWALVYPFLSTKLKERIYFHENYDSLKKYFPDNLLPVDFGGQLKDDESSRQWLRRALKPENLQKLED